MARRHEDAPIDRLLEADAERRALMTEGETLRAERNETSKKLSRINPKPPELIAEMRGVGERIKDLEAKSGTLRDEIDHILARLPNIAAPNVPDGEDETGNVVLQEDADLPTFDFEPRPHWELGEALGILDFERGQRISGSRFYTLTGAGAKLQRALIQWMLDRHIDRHGYTEVYLPYMVREQTIFGAGQLPKFRDNLYHDAEEDYWMVPTAEVPITGLYSGEILPPGSLPLKHVAYTACFRREKMSAGKDIRGLKRGHQFDKVEMYQIVEPADSTAALQDLVVHAQDIAGALGLPNRLLQLCAGRPRLRRRGVVRHRGLGRRLPGVARSQQLLELRRLPSAPRQHPLPHRAERPAGLPPHPQRLGARPPAHHDRHPGEQPAARRLGPGAGGAAPVHGVRADRGGLARLADTEHELVTGLPRLVRRSPRQDPAIVSRRCVVESERQRH